MSARAPNEARRPVRVAHVLNSLGMGGVPEAAWQLMRRQPEGHVRQQVYLLSQGQGHDEHRQQRLAQFRELGAEVAVAPRAEDGLSSTAQALQRVSALAQWLRRTGVDIVHTHSYKPNLQGRLAAALLRPRGLRVVAHYHNTYDDKWQREGTGALDAQLAEVSDALLACSHHVATDLARRLDLPAERIEVLRNGVDLATFRRADPAEVLAVRQAWGARPDQPLVACVGRLCAQKGQDLFLRAAAEVARARPDAVFLVVGTPDSEADLARLQTLAGELGLAAPRLHFTGRIGSGAPMAALYSALDLLVAPSRWEGFGLMLVEAMACGCPLLASRVGAIPEVVEAGRSAELVAPDDPTALAHALQALLAAPGHRAALGRAGPQRAAHFSWDHAAAQLTRLYEGLASPVGPGR